MKPPRSRFPVLLAFLVCTMWAAAARAQTPDPSMSSATADSGVVVASFPGMDPALRQTLAEQGHPITVTIRDAAGDPVAGVDPSRITFEADNPARMTLHEPLTADAPTDASGQTTISGYLNASGIPWATVVRLDGVALGSGPLSLDVAAPDAQEGMVDLMDAVLMVLGMKNFNAGTYSPWNDLNRDMSVGLADQSLQAGAMGARYPGTPDPYLSPSAGTLGLYFDGAGTVTVHEYDHDADGGQLNLYVVARNLTEPIGGLEFRVPEFEDADLTFLYPAWYVPTYMFGAGGPSEYQVAFAENLPFDASIEIVEIRMLVSEPLVNRTFTVEPISDPLCSFRSPNRPGWVSTGAFLYRRPFAATSSAIVNPTYAVFEGLDHIQEDGAFVEVLPDLVRLSLPNGGSGSMGMGMGSAGGAGGAGSDGHSMDFLPPVDLGQIPVGAELDWDYEDANGTPLVSLANVNTGNGISVSFDASAIGASTVSLELYNGGNLVEARSGYSGNWTTFTALPSSQSLSRNGQDLSLVQVVEPPSTIVLDDQSQFVVDEIRVIPENPSPMPATFLKRVRAKVVDFPPVEIARHGLQRFDTSYSGAQNLFYVSETSRMYLLLRDPAGPASVDLSATNGQPILFRGRPSPHPDGTPDTLVADYSHGAGSALPGLQLSLTEQAPGVAVKLGFFEQGAKSCGVVARLNGQVVEQFAALGEAIGLAGAWPSSQGMEGNDLVLRWSQPTDLALNSSQAQSPVTADELRLTPVDPQALPDGTMMTLDLAGTKWVEVTDDQATTAVPPGRTNGLALSANAPNPFNASTRFQFSLPRAGRVTLKVYDPRGRLVATPLDAWRQAGPGTVSWRGLDLNGRHVASGMYYTVLENGGERRTRKIILVN